MNPVNRESELEYNRWRLFCDEARAVGIDPNNPKLNRMFRAVAMWGEALSDLRHTQTAEQREKARAMATRDYEVSKRPLTKQSK